MSKPIQLTDELLDSLPALKKIIARKLWYAYYRELRIEHKKRLEELLYGSGSGSNMLGILNQTGVKTNGK